MDEFPATIGLKECGVVSPDESQLKVDVSELHEGHVSFGFNPPALPSILYMALGKAQYRRVDSRTFESVARPYQDAASMDTREPRDRRVG